MTAETELVAPLAGSVDRNIPSTYKDAQDKPVAPLAGSVDRNTEVQRMNKEAVVAPLAGSVDRNVSLALVYIASFLSLPSRGAWIEICFARHRP